MEEHEEWIEWRVESETTEDEFGTDEEGAREWLARCQDNPEWEPVTLMRRTVTRDATAWEAI
jgi:hypothetical protein